MLIQWQQSCEVNVRLLVLHPLVFLWRDGSGDLLTFKLVFVLHHHPIH